jgi:HSP20 family molecular chaperone IbpA
MFYAVTTRPNTTQNNGTARISNNGPLDKFLSDTLSSLSNSGAARAPSVEDLETGYKLQLDVPGLSKEQLDIGIEGDVVRVTSKADAPRQVKAAWRFPLEVDVAASSATLENGVLTLTLGKKIPVSNVSQLVIQ